MNQLEINKYLTEAMGGHLVTVKANGHTYQHYKKDGFIMDWDFFTPDGFFKLWGWAQKQKWWDKFADTYYLTPSCGGTMAAQLEYLVNPKHLAPALYEFLKGES